MIFNSGKHEHQQIFYGLAADFVNLPINSNNGDKFIAIDTGKQYLFDKQNGIWAEKPDDVKAELQAIKVQLAGIIDGSSPATSQLTGSTVDLRGLNANKPLASAVDVGTTYWSVDTDPNAESIEVSDGTNWAVV